MTKYTKVTIEAVSEDSIQYDGTWVMVNENAQKFLNKFSAGDYASIGVDDQNKVVFIKKLDDINSKHQESKQEEPKTTNVEGTNNVSSKKKTMSPNEYRGLQSQVGGLTHDAVQLAISEKEEDEDIIESIRDNIRALKRIQDELCEEFKEDYENEK